VPLSLSICAETSAWLGKPVILRSPKPQQEPEAMQTQMPSLSNNGYGIYFEHKLQTPSTHTSPNINTNELHPQ
jgi:hypothetical protein